MDASDELVSILVEALVESLVEALERLKPHGQHELRVAGKIKYFIHALKINILVAGESSNS